MLIIRHLHDREKDEVKLRLCVSACYPSPKQCRNIAQAEKCGIRPVADPTAGFAR